MELIVASNNKGKIKEFKKILEPLGFEVFSQSEKNINIEVEETGTTFEENAFLKANAIYELINKCVIADDSGLEVEELNNEPGIFSARYKGLETEEQRRQSILKQLDGKENRNAKFTCCIYFIKENGEKKVFKGIWNGKIAEKEEGENGFGYDPIFIPDSSNGKTVAQMPDEYKNEFSHRAKAIKMLLEYLENNK